MDNKKNFDSRQSYTHTFATAAAPPPQPETKPTAAETIVTATEDTSECVETVTCPGAFSYIVASMCDTDLKCLECLLQMDPAVCTSYCTSVEVIVPNVDNALASTIPLACLTPSINNCSTLRITLPIQLHFGVPCPSLICE